MLILNAENGNLIAQFKAHVGDVTALEFSSSSAVVSASVDGMIKLWRFSDQRETVHHTSNPWLRSSVPDLTASDSGAPSGTLRGSLASASVGSTAAPSLPPVTGQLQTKNGIRLPEREGKLSMRVTSLFAKSWKPRALVLSVRNAGILQVRNLCSI